MLVMEDQLTGLTTGVWESFLGLPIAPCASTSTAGVPSLTTSVTISGGWNGSVSIVMSQTLARTVAAAMFAMEPDEVGDEEVNDAVGELANIIGGNVKGLIEDPCSLSLPMVASGSDYSVTVPGTRLQQEAFLESEGHVVRVAVHTTA